MRLRLLAIFPLAGLLAGTAADVHADPITLTYQVTVQYRNDFTVPLSQSDWVPIQPMSFVLSMSFDGTVTDQTTQLGSVEGYRTTYFGAPTFSEVPLSGAGVTTGTLSAQTRLTNGYYSGGPIQQALAVSQLSSDNGTSGSSTNVQLFAPTLDPSLGSDAFGDLTTFLRAMNSSNLQFFFFDVAYTANLDAEGRRLAPTFAPGSAGFMGTAVQIAAAPTPEPGSLLLIGTGLAGAVLRRFRPKRQR